ncbi:hypothetical protein ACRYI5_10825 [Furfurilactobacillus sp. WILCCON 0119]
MQELGQFLESIINNFIVSFKASAAPVLSALLLCFLAQLICYLTSLYIAVLLLWALLSSATSFLIAGKLNDDPWLLLQFLVLVGLPIEIVGLKIMKHLRSFMIRLWRPQRVVKFPCFDATNHFVFHASVDVMNRAKHKKIVLPRKLHNRTEGAKINAKDLPALDSDAQAVLEDLAQTIGYQAIAQFVETTLHNSQERKDR